MGLHNVRSVRKYIKNSRTLCLYSFRYKIYRLIGSKNGLDCSSWLWKCHEFNNFDDSSAYFLNFICYYLIEFGLKYACYLAKNVTFGLSNSVVIHDCFILAILNFIWLSSSHTYPYFSCLAWTAILEVLWTPCCIFLGYGGLNSTSSRVSQYTG